MDYYYLWREPRAVSHRCVPAWPKVENCRGIIDVPFALSRTQIDVVYVVQFISCRIICFPFFPLCFLPFASTSCSPWWQFTPGATSSGLWRVLVIIAIQRRRKPHSYKIPMPSVNHSPFRRTKSRDKITTAAHGIRIHHPFCSRANVIVYAMLESVVRIICARCARATVANVKNSFRIIITRQMRRNKCISAYIIRSRLLCATVATERNRNQNERQTNVAYYMQTHRHAFTFNQSNVLLNKMRAVNGVWADCGSITHH